MTNIGAYTPYITKKTNYLRNCVLEPEIPFKIIKNLNFEKYNGDSDFITFSKSPNYTPKSADFIIDIMKNYIKE